MSPERPSTTAQIIAAAVLAAYQDGLGPRPAAESVHLAKSVLATTRFGRLLLWSTHSRIGCSLRRTLQCRISSGFVPHVARRKAWIERACRESLAGGSERLIVLGAGFDGLAPRLAAAMPRIEIVEADHPATQRIKSEVLSSVKEARPTMVAIDLSHEPVSVQRLGPAERDCGITIVAEGLLMYLTRERVDRLLTEIAAMTHQRVDLIFTFMETQRDGHPGFRGHGWAARRWLRAVGEPIFWGATRDEMAAWLHTRDFRVLEMAGDIDLAREWPGQVLEGEVLVRAVRN